MSFNECTNLIKMYQKSNLVTDNFFEYVFTKITSVKSNRFVIKNDDSIDIIPPSNSAIKVIPIYKKIKVDNLKIHNEIKRAVELIKNGTINNIYFVYPKNETFTRHIEVKVPELEDTHKGEYLIKIIPYSLNSIQRKCNGNCNILCK